MGGNHLLMDLEDFDYSNTFVIGGGGDSAFDMYDAAGSGADVDMDNSYLN